jgi:hypothetical protein
MKELENESHPHRHPRTPPKSTICNVNRPRSCTIARRSSLRVVGGGPGHRGQRGSVSPRKRTVAQEPACCGPEFFAVHRIYRPERCGTGLLFPLYRHFAEHQQSAASIAAFQDAEVKVTIDDQYQMVAGQFASGNLLDLLGVRPALGRGFLADDTTN